MTRRLAPRVIALTLCLSALGATAAQAAAPTISKTRVTGVGTDLAVLEAEVNPGSKATLYRFEYGFEDCETSTCTKVPVPDGQILPGSSPVPVAAHIEGLSPGTTYHMRVVAKNSEGEVEGPDRTFSTHVPALDGLPDGRAYEQASPVNKNAADARGLVAWVKAADHGNAVSFLSTSGIPGGEGGQEVPAYLATRGATDWSTQGLLPPGTEGNTASVRGWLPDFSTVFDFVGDFGGGPGGGAFYARSSADGSLSEIVAKGEGLQKTAAFAGASSDGSVVVFESRDALPCCPEAVGGASNVYLWDRESDQVSLASVLNDGTSPPKGAFAGPYDWIATPQLPLKASEGGSASASYTQDLHAVSEQGDVLYFTAAGEGQLYARVNPTAAQSLLDEGECTDPQLACTIEVSASQRIPPDPLGQRPAAFMAATPDGQRAFFASPEELTDDANTGPEQGVPAIQSAEASDGDPIEDVVPAAATGIAIDDEFVYWVNSQADAIGRAELTGGDVNTTFISIPPRKECPPAPAGDEDCTEEEEEPVDANPQDVAVDDEFVYWTNERSGNRKAGTIGRADINGTLASIEAEWIEGATRPKGIAVNATHVFWANAGRGATKEGTIGRAEIDGEPVDHEFIPGIGTQRPEGVAIGASYVYWTVIQPVGNGGAIRRADLEDGENQVDVFIGNDVELRGLAVDATHLYWASQGEEAIGRIPLADIPGICNLIVTCDREFIELDGRPKGLAVNTADLYWSVNGEAVPNPGNDLYLYEAGELTDLTPDPSAENGAEVKGVLGTSQDGKRIYFAANGDLDGGVPVAAGDCEGSVTGVVGFSGECSLYLAEEEEPGEWARSFIARLDVGGGCGVSNTPSDATNWIGKAGGGICRLQRTARISADGSVLLFRSQQKLSDYDNEGVPQLYRFEIGEGIACVSCNPTGQAPVGEATLGNIGLSALEPGEPANVLSRNLSSDGNRVFFQSSDALVVDDTNGADGCALEGALGVGFNFPSCQDPYMWEAEGTGSCTEDVQGGGCLYLLSTGTSPNASFFADASLSGDDAFIATRSSGLVRQDQDQLQDIFDLRVGGGLASQNQPPKPPCEGLDGCRPPATPPPSFQSPGSASFTGPANKKQARKKAKKRRGKKRGQKKRRQQARRAAQRNQRSGK